MRHAFDAIGTSWKIDVPGELPREVLARIEEFDRAYSRFRNDSLVTAMSRQAGEYRLPDDAEPMFDVYEKLYRLTNGGFTPLIGQTLSDAGYDATYSFREGVVMRPPPWDEVMRRDGQTLEVREPVLLDFGAAGKGYLVDLVGGVLREKGIDDFVIDAGGDILQRSSLNEPLHVGLEHPEHPDQAIGIATILNQSLCGSAGNRRTWGKYHHTIDPRTLESPRHILATWVAADTSMLADALATCLVLTDVEILTAAFDFEYLLLYPDYTVKKSAGFPAELFHS